MPTFDAPTIPLARPSASIRVARYDASAGSFFSLPNIRCLEIQVREGPEPGVARFRYVLDSNSDPSFPARVEDILAFDKSSPYVVRQDDRVVVIKDDADGGITYLFDGFAQMPQADLDGKGEQVSFQAQGVAVREWGTPIEGAIQRDCDAKTTPNTGDIATGLPTRFNPNGWPNCTPDSTNSGTSPQDYPVFLSEVYAQSDPASWTQWTVAKACRYLIARGNPDETYVKNPNFAILDDLLTTRSPKEGDFFDVNDPSTYNTDPIRCQDFDATGEPWPVAVAKLIEPHGFNLTFRLSCTSDGLPQTSLDIVRRDGGDEIQPKSLLLQVPGDTLDPGQSNLGRLSLSRDTTGIVNRWTIDTESIRYEASFVLAPGFTIAAGDVSSAADYRSDSPNFATGSNRDKYRKFIFDEVGEGHWDFGTNATVTTIPSLDDVLGAPSVDPVTHKSTRLYAHNPRPGIRQLVSLDSHYKELNAELWVSTDYAGKKPGVWDGTGTWHKITSTEWQLLQTRLGIRLTMLNPDSWKAYDKPTTGVTLNGGGNIRLVKSLASPDTVNPVFHFRLTCVIEGDQGLTAVAYKRSVSATSFEITRRHDARDRFRKRIISVKSHLNTTGKDVNQVDDTPNALAHVEALRLAHEAARFAGSPEIPRFTLAYRLGDKIDRVKGREISLESVVGMEQGEGARYPTVVGITWNFDGHQRTILDLEDRRAEPPVRRSR